MEIAGGYKKAVRAHLPHARIIFDRFHVQRLAGNAIDEVCRDEVRAVEDASAVRAIKRSRYALLKRPWNLSRREHDKLADIQTNNPRLYRARLLNDTLADALVYGETKRARRAIGSTGERPPRRYAKHSAERSCHRSSRRKMKSPSTRRHNRSRRRP